MQEVGWNRRVGIKGKGGCNHTDGCFQYHRHLDRAAEGTVDRS